MMVALDPVRAGATEAAKPNRQEELAVCLTRSIVVGILVASSVGGFCAGGESNPTNEIRFVLRNNRPVIQVSLNGSEPLQFVLDTGASGKWYIDKKRARDLELIIENERSLPIGVGRRNVYLAETKGVVIELGTQRFRDSTLNVLDLSPIESFDGAQLDGIVGAGFLLGYVAEMDYPSFTIRLFRRSDFSYSGSKEVVELNTSSRLPVATFAIEIPGKASIEFRGLIDTGSHHALVLSREVFGPTDLPVGNDPEPTTIGFAVGGPIKGFLGEIDRFHFGNEHFNGVPVVFPEKNGIFRDGMFEGIVGGAILKHFCVVLDFWDGAMILDRKVDAFSPDLNNSGLVLIRPGPLFERTLVYSVVPGSPAAVAGITTGDEITSFAGIPAIDMSLEKIRSHLLRGGEKVLVKIKRENESIGLLLRLGDDDAD